MIKRKKLALLVCLISLIGFSQEFDVKKPNYKKIEREISKEKSELYYPKLMKKYLNSDSTMTIVEKRHLYYGFSFQERYSPYGFSEFNDSLRNILKKETLKEKEFNKIIKFSDSVLVDNPFDLRAINFQLYSYENLGKKKEFNDKLMQMKIIIDAMLSSGDGLKKESAFYVIYVSHEYDLLDILGYEYGGEQSLIDHYDYLKLVENDKGIKGVYFDISPSLNSLSKMLD